MKTWREDNTVTVFRIVIVLVRQLTERLLFLSRQCHRKQLPVIVSPYNYPDHHSIRRRIVMIAAILFENKSRMRIRSEKKKEK